VRYIDEVGQILDSDFFLTKKLKKKKKRKKKGTLYVLCIKLPILERRVFFLKKN
jgi:hypothetical protein